MRAGWLCGLLTVVSCSPGVGRSPVFPDAAVRPEAGIADSGPPDAGFVDAGPRDVPVFLPDTGPPPPLYDFTGSYGILNSSDALFAREVRGELHLVIGAFPYTYTGTIDAAGQVDLTSPELANSGCPEARITGTFSRPDTLFDLQHQTCNTAGEPLNGQIRGGFASNYDDRVSGEYEVRMEVINDVTNCIGLGVLSDPGYWGVSVLSDRTIAVFVAEDPAAAPAVYFGRAQQDLSGFDALQHLDAAANGSQFAMRARIELISALDPVRIVGTRDVFRPGTGCTFTVSFEASRISAP